MILTIFILPILVTLCHAFDTLLNIDELNLIHYNVDITKDPVLKDQEWENDIVTMTNKYGQEYICLLPKVQLGEREPKKEDELLDQLVDITELLKPMEQAPCLIKKKDWWTYEFCYGSSIKQYHSEDDKVSSATVILGKFESEYNWKNSTEAKNKLQKFHSQFYANGTKCDITGEPRSAEVRFHCEEGAGDYIQRVDEPESCRYIVVIATTKLCHHPYLRSHPNRASHDITCSPALTKDQFQKYNEIQQVKSDISETSFIDGEESSKSDITDLDDDDKLSIRFFTIPVGGKNSAKMALKEKGILIAEDPPDQNAILKDVANEAQKYTKSLNEKVVSALNSKYEKAQSYMTEKDAELDVDTRERVDGSRVAELNNDEVTTKKLEEVSTEDLEEKNEARDDIEVARLKLLKLLEKWKVMQEESSKEDNEENLKALYEKFEFLQETGTALLDNSLSVLVDDLETLGNKIRSRKAEAKHIEQGSEDQAVDDALAERMKKLSREFKETESEVVKAKEKIVRVSDYLRDKLGDDLREVIELEKDQKRWSQLDTDDLSGDKFDTFTKESKKTDSEIKEDNEVEPSGKKVDSDRRLKLEQGIRDRLQRQGLTNIGRKIEVKVLDPNHGGDEHALSSLSLEESEAFQDMIVNILSANAEELQERERHKNLEVNYKFDIGDTEPSAIQEEVSEESRDSVSEQLEETLQDPLSGQILEDL